MPWPRYCFLGGATGSFCLYGVDLYLAQRLLATEKRLVKATRGTQLLREDLDEREELARNYDNGATRAARPAPHTVVRAVSDA